MDKICIIVPCYNEEFRLDQNTFLKFSNQNSHIDFLFVNDGSIDNTQEVLDNLQIKNKRLKNIQLSENAGKAEAVRKGMLSLNKSDFNFIGYWDADLATPLEEIERFMNIFNDNNRIKLVTGCRHKRLGVHIERNKYRHYFGRFFAMAASLILHLPVYDTQCGAKIFRAELLANIFENKFFSKWFFDVEIFFRLKKKIPNASDLIYELPLNKWVDVEGSKIKLVDFIKVPFEILKIYYHYKN